MSVTEIVQRLNGKRSGEGWKAKCPAHIDRMPSLSIKEGSDGRVLLHCHAGCSIDDILRVLGLAVRDLFPTQTSVLVNAPKQAAVTEAKPAPVQPRPLGELLDAVVGILRRYVVFPLQEEATVIAAWIAHTWLFDAFDYTAYLFVFSAAKRSGKSRVLEVIEQLAKNPRLTPGASAAALMRSNDESSPPTMLLDEVDTIYSNKGDSEAENTRRFLNAGYRRGSKFLRCVGQGADIHVKEFPAFCPKAFAGIDRCLPDTVLDRSLPIELERQSREEKAERFREREVRAVVARIRAELEAWGQQPGVIDMLRDARPVLPEELNDRQQDITEPLLAIADLAGGEWPNSLRSALVKLCTNEEDADIGVKLLGAIKAVFDSTGDNKLTTDDILHALVAIEDGPWALMFEDALKLNKLQTAASKLAKKLKPYKTPDGKKIKPRSIKLGDGTVARGYYKEDFWAAWGKYLPPVPGKAATSATSATSATTEGKTVAATAFQGATENTREVAVVATVAPLRERGRQGTSATPNSDRKNIDAMTDAEFEAWWNRGKSLWPGDWLLFKDAAGFKAFWVGRQPLPETCIGLEDSDCHDDLDACLDTLACGCNLAEEPDGFYYHRTRHVARCRDCQNAEWMAQGFEVEHGFPYGDWDLTTAERIAERDRYARQELEQWERQRQERLVAEAKALFNATAAQ
jgi:Protein of unknown function (DUF3631)